MNIRTVRQLLAAAAAFTLSASPVTLRAVDGQIAITQARVLAGGITPGDAPGFPVTITQPGSYVLAGNLTIPDSTTAAIVIASDHVTLDLNGFAVLGPVDCSGGLDFCAGLAPGWKDGISTDVDRFNITIRNGTVQGMGGWGISLGGDSHIVEHVHVRSNGNGGVSVFSGSDRGGSIIRSLTVQRNGGNAAGIRVYNALVTQNIVDVHRTGIEASQGTVSHNVVTRNTFGLDLVVAGFFDNTMRENGANVLGGHTMGRNLCGDSSC